MAGLPFQLFERRILSIVDRENLHPGASNTVLLGDLEGGRFGVDRPTTAIFEHLRPFGIHLAPEEWHPRSPVIIPPPSAAGGIRGAGGPPRSGRRTWSTERWPSSSARQ